MVTRLLSSSVLILGLLGGSALANGALSTAKVSIQSDRFGPDDAASLFMLYPQGAAGPGSYKLILETPLPEPAIRAFNAAKTTEEAEKIMRERIRPIEDSKGFSEAALEDGSRLDGFINMVSGKCGDASCPDKIYFVVSLTLGLLGQAAGSPDGLAVDLYRPGGEKVPLRIEQAAVRKFFMEAESLGVDALHGWTLMEMDNPFDRTKNLLQLSRFSSDEKLGGEVALTCAPGDGGMMDGAAVWIPRRNFARKNGDSAPVRWAVDGKPAVSGDWHALGPQLSILRMVADGREVDAFRGALASARKLDISATDADGKGVTVSFDLKDSAPALENMKTLCAAPSPEPTGTQ